MRLHSNISVADLKPSQALEILQEGNFRFINNLQKQRDNLSIVSQTAEGQSPFAAVLSCMDSRTGSELTFDQGLGDIFSIRVAGNVVTTTILGSLEYAVAVSGVKLILVLGHTNCGAIKGACDKVEMGHLTGLLARIQPALMLEKTETGDRSSQNAAFVNKVSIENAKVSCQQIVQQSDILKDAVADGSVGIVPAIYDVATGHVDFLLEYAMFKEIAAPLTRLEPQLAD